MNEMYFMAPSWVCSPDSVRLVLTQYSQKEDKYEEEIKVLSDKLKEVS